ncbi:putative FAS1 domain-containing protein [Helianthus anomalus]
MRLSRGGSKSSIAFIAVIVSVSSYFVLILSVLRLLDVSVTSGSKSLFKPKQVSKSLENGDRFGKFGEMMIEMLLRDLSFTIFVPSEFAFERDLRFRVNDSLAEEKANDTNAILTRVLSITVVPWKTLSESLSCSEEITCDSLSGLKLYVSKDAD